MKEIYSHGSLLRMDAGFMEMMIIEGVDTDLSLG